MIASPRTSRYESDLDRQLHAAASEILASSKYTPLRQLDCRVSGGVVEITGTVATYYLKQMAQAAMIGLEGRVRNLVEVRTDGHRLRNPARPRQQAG